MVGNSGIAPDLIKENVSLKISVHPSVVGDSLQESSITDISSSGFSHPRREICIRSSSTSSLSTSSFFAFLKSRYMSANFSIFGFQSNVGIAALILALFSSSLSTIDICAFQTSSSGILSRVGANLSNSDTASFSCLAISSGSMYSLYLEADKTLSSCIEGALLSAAVNCQLPPHLTK